jgi:hypothetical protein
MEARRSLTADSARFPGKEATKDTLEPGRLAGTAALGKADLSKPSLPVNVTCITLTLILLIVRDVSFVNTQSVLPRIGSAGSINVSRFQFAEMGS